jgi:hypothetical protein
MRPQAHHVVAALAASLLLTACGSSSVGPTTGNNQALIDHFTPILAHADSLGQHERASAIIDIIALLQVGSPTNAITVNIDGRNLRFTAVDALLAAGDSTGALVDSAYVISAWRDVNADTTVQTLISNTPPLVAGAAQRIVVPLARLRAWRAASRVLADNGLGSSADIVYAVDDSVWSESTPNVTVGLQLGQTSGTCHSFGTPNLPFTVLSCKQLRSTSSFSGTLTTFDETTRSVAMGPTTLSGVAVNVQNTSQTNRVIPR